MPLDTLHKINRNLGGIRYLPQTRSYIAQNLPRLDQDKLFYDRKHSMRRFAENTFLAEPKPRHINITLANFMDESKRSIAVHLSQKALKDAEVEIERNVNGKLQKVKVNPITDLMSINDKLVCLEKLMSDSSKKDAILLTKISALTDIIKDNNKENNDAWTKMLDLTRQSNMLIANQSVDQSLGQRLFSLKEFESDLPKIMLKLLQDKKDKIDRITYSDGAVGLLDNRQTGVTPLSVAGIQQTLKGKGRGLYKFLQFDAKEGVWLSIRDAILIIQDDGTINNGILDLYTGADNFSRTKLIGLDFGVLINQLKDIRNVEEGASSSNTPPPGTPPIAPTTPIVIDPDIDFFLTPSRPPATPSASAATDPPATPSASAATDPQATPQNAHLQNFDL